MFMLRKFETFNVLQLSFGFFLVLFAFTTQGFIEETVINSYAQRENINKRVGYISLAIIYAFDTLGNFLAPSFIEIFGIRWSFILAVSTFVLFHAGFLFLNEIYLLVSSGLVGFGAAIFWTVQGEYLTINSNKHNAGMHSAIFWASAHGCLAFGGLFLYFIFNNQEGDLYISDHTTKIIYGSFTGVCIVGLAMLGSLRVKHDSTLIENESEIKSIKSETSTSAVGMLKSTFNLMLTPRMRFLIIPFMFTGLELSFWSGIYPTCISFTRRLGYNTNSLVAFNAIAQGLGQIFAALFFCVLNSKFQNINRPIIVLVGTLTHLLVFGAIFVNFPIDSPLDRTDSKAIIGPNIAIALICGFFIAFADACWNTQIFSFLITHFPEQGSQAFALNLFFENLMTSASFFYGTSVELQYHLVILSTGAILGCIRFFFAEKVQTVTPEKSIKNDKS